MIILLAAAAAAVSGQTVIWAIFKLIVYGLIFWVLWGVLDQLKPREPFYMVAKAILILGAAFIVINALLSLLGTPLVVWI